MDPITEPRRVRRFQRNSSARQIKITERDIAMLQHVARHRFLSSDHLAALDGGSGQNVRRCLRVLFDHDFLDRPYAQLAHVPMLGNRPMVYGLGKRGAHILAEHGQNLYAGINWGERNKRAGAKFIEHTLAIADFMTALEIACRDSGTVKLLREGDILASAPERTRAAREPLRITVPGLDNKFGVSSVVADGLFGLLFPNETAVYFLLEMDRGSMPVVRSHYDQTSFQRKLAVYWEVWRRGRHLEHFGIKQLRVLTVTDTAPRVENMLAAVRNLTGGKGSNFFLFAEKSRFHGRPPTDVWWTTGRGEMVRIID